jgi:hypothetical protein
MIARIIWPGNPLNGPVSPFSLGNQERGLRITFHWSNLVNLSTEDRLSLEVLLQLANHPHIKPLGTEQGPFSYLNIGQFVPNSEYIPVSVNYTDSTRHTGVWFPDQALQMAAGSIGQNNLDHPDVQVAFQDIIIAYAHRQLDQDILITNSPYLLAHRSATVSDTNPRRPSEAAKIVGLFLRSSNSYILPTEQLGNISTNHGAIYLILARHKLPNMWRYISACTQSSPLRGDDTTYLGQGILARCVRAIEARDAIGKQFYAPQNHDTRDAMMYHFDYLTLLLAGAFDAQARIARRAYGIARPTERNTSFGSEQFLNALINHAAIDIHAIVKGAYFRNIRTLIHELRNTIHGASMPTIAAMRGVEPQESYVQVLPEYRDSLWGAAEQCGSPEQWGLIKTRDEVWLEPYTYATTLVEESFRLLNLIATATDVTGLFAGHPIPPLTDDLPDNEVFNESTMRRLGTLG